MRLAMVAVADLVPAKNNVRSDLEDLEELTASLEAVGLLQPLLVKALASAAGRVRYEVIDGNRRTYALRGTTIDKVLCLVRDEVGESRDVAAMLAASMHRALPPMDQARGFQRLVKAGMDVAKISAVTGFKPTIIADRLKLLTLPKEAQLMVSEGQLGTTEATRLARELAKAPVAAVAPLRSAAKPVWFSPQHRLAAAAAALCDHQAGRVVVGRTACGECWERAIVADALDRREAGVGAAA